MIIAAFLPYTRRITEPFYHEHASGKDTERGVLVALLFGAGMYAAFAFLPEFVETPRAADYGFSANITESGLFLLPLTITMFLMGLISGRLASRMGMKAPVVLGAAIGVLPLVQSHLIWRSSVAGGFMDGSSPYSLPDSQRRVRARALGISIGRLTPGALNAITDVLGVRVGHTTLISGEGPLVAGYGPVRTGVTVIMPREGNPSADPLFAGYHVLNGNGEMTGLPWIEESGLLTTPIAITNTHSVGVVRDALIAYEIARSNSLDSSFSLPVVAETYDGFLSDINGMHVRPEHVFAAFDAATNGPVAEGCVGGGTGMICHGFKGGIGTASRVLPAQQGGWTVGVLVQANHGQRALLRVDGVPVGQEIPPEEVPTPRMSIPPGTGSIIVIVATNAPLLPGGCRRLAQRATLGIARAGGLGENSSGDIFLAFSTAQHGLDAPREPGETITVQMLPNEAMTPLFEAVADSTEEAILNALCAAVTTTGVNGHTAHALPLDRLRAIMQHYHRIAGTDPA